MEITEQTRQAIDEHVAPSRLLDHAKVESTVNTSASRFGSGSDVGVGLSVPMFGGGGSGRYSAEMDILVQDGQKPQGKPDAYDAFSVISRLQPKVLAGGS